MVEGEPGGRATIAAETIGTLSADGQAALQGQAATFPTAVRLTDVDILTMTLPLPGGGRVTRAAVARALARRTPVALARLYWGHAAGENGGVRVAMAHRDRVDALIATLDEKGITMGPVLADGIVLVLDERAGGRPSWWWLLATIPLLTGIGGRVLTGAGEVRIARLAPIADARAADGVARGRAAAVFARPAIGDLLARMDAGLPPGATLHAIGMGGDGAVDVEIDTEDPGELRDALARDPVLARLRTVAQAAVADRGIRMLMRIDRP
ncbi:hypothetical protein [Sphingomonas montana]|uniref:hypothetical protein n=1 Tax=Sphingomonas montana TaxID=1843236 RepID=UPI00096F290C|nr:hypothetical protein [Sphingomonas montana]